MHPCPYPHHWGRESWHLQWGSENCPTPECQFEPFLGICIFSSGWTKKLKVKVLFAQSCLTACDSMDHSLPGSSVYQILQARILEWVASSFSRGSSWPRDQTRVSCIAGRFFTIWTTRETVNEQRIIFKLYRHHLPSSCNFCCKQPAFQAWPGNLQRFLKAIWLPCPPVGFCCQDPFGGCNVPLARFYPSFPEQIQATHPQIVFHILKKIINVKKKKKLVVYQEPPRGWRSSGKKFSKSA